MRALLAIALLVAGCEGCEDTLTSWAVEGEAVHGTVFVCDSDHECLSETGQPASEEWCWDGPEVELEAHLDAECHRISIFERLWPGLVGCAYCCGPNHACPVITQRSHR